MVEYSPDNQWTDRTGSIEPVVQSLPIDEDNLSEIYPIFGRMLDGESWLLRLDLGRGIEVIHPTTMYWVEPDGSRSRQYVLGTNQKLLLEFLLEVPEEEKLREARLSLGEVPDDSLAQQIDPVAIKSLIQGIDDWLAHYTRQSAPFVVSSSGIVAGSDPRYPDRPESIGTATAQAYLMVACLLAYQESGILRMRERSVALAEALVTYFYRSQPLQASVEWFPHEFVNAGERFRTHGPVASTPDRYGYYSYVVDFTNGIGLIPDTSAQVFAVYSGKLQDARLDAPLLEGSRYSYQAETVEGGTQITLVEKTEEIAPSNVAYLSARSAADLSFSYAIFPWAVL